MRRNLFMQHRRPTASSSTSAETLRLDTDTEPETADIVIRDKNGDFEVGDPDIPPVDDQDVGAGDEFEDESKLILELVRWHGD